LSSSGNDSERGEGNACLALSPCWFWRSCINRVRHHRGQFIPFALWQWTRPRVTSPAGDRREDIVREAKKCTRIFQGIHYTPWEARTSRL
jgi:hypothetical protein